MQKGLNKKQKSKELETKKLKLLIQNINMHIKSKDSSNKVLEFVNLPRYWVQGQYKKQTKLFNLSLRCCCSVVKLCPTLCDSVDCFTPGNGACIPQWIYEPCCAEPPKTNGHSEEFWQNVVHWRMKWEPTPVFLPRKPHGQYLYISETKEK